MIVNDDLQKKTKTIRYRNSKRKNKRDSNNIVHNLFQFQKISNDHFSFIVNDEIFENDNADLNNVIENNKIISFEFL